MRPTVPILLAAISVLVLVPATRSATVDLISVSTAGGQGNSDSTGADVSAGGRVVAFYATANNLVPGDTNGFSDVFVRDLDAGTTTRINLAQNGAQANHISSGDIAISADGRLVAFVSTASNLVPGDTNGFDDVFVHDRQTGLTERVSVATDGAQGDKNSGFGLDLSADGRYVAFGSSASNLVAGDTNALPDVFVHDRVTKTTTLESVAASGQKGNHASRRPSLSADGRYVVFESTASNLDPAFLASGWEQIYRRDRVGNVTQLLTPSIIAVGWGANNPSWAPDISADGGAVSFLSAAQDLVPGDTNIASDIFVRILAQPSVQLVTKSPVGAPADSRSSLLHAIAPDGSAILFQSSAGNLVPGAGGASPQRWDWFKADLAGGGITLVSAAADSSGGTKSFLEAQYVPGLSHDGATAVFTSYSSLLVTGDSNNAFDVYASCSPPACPAAAVSSYGAGKPGSMGVPVLSSAAPPVLGGMTDVTLTGGLPGASPVLLFVGLTPAAIPFDGGTLLVQPALTLGLPPLDPSGGFSLPVALPVDSTLCGGLLFLQALFGDPGANGFYGSAQTQGLAWTLGA